jgi:hypothetical protein
VLFETFEVLLLFEAPFEHYESHQSRIDLLEYDARSLQEKRRMNLHFVVLLSFSSSALDVHITLRTCDQNGTFRAYRHAHARIRTAKASSRLCSNPMIPDDWGSEDVLALELLLEKQPRKTTTRFAILRIDDRATLNWNLHQMKQQVESSFRWVIGAVLLIVLAMFLGSVAGRRHSTGKPHEGEAAPSREVSESLHEVSIRRPAGPPRMSLKTAAGETVTVACTNCHANRPADVLNTKPEHLDEFHQNLKVSHGKIACLSCHNSDNYDALKLANGESVDFENVMQLCVQCHGNKGKDFENGAHGGMTGHWDLSRGPRQRNNCVDCHDPHSPAFPAMKPTFKPRDRFLESTTHQGDH